MVDFGGVITPAANDRVRRLHLRLTADPPPGFRGAVPAFASLLVRFDPLTADPDAFFDTLTRLARMAGGGPSPPGRQFEVPAVYGGEFGPDLAELAAGAGLTEDQAAAIHAGRTYRVYMLGFLVGFPYLAPVAPRIAAPRRADPRLRVPAGSIGIAGRQTGIYPVTAPGGWQLVARTPVRLWDPSRYPPAALRPGDRIRFRRVPAAEFAAREGDLPWPEARPAPPDPEPGRGVLRVVAAGPLTTVQDGGRAGHEEFGVPAGGALDEVSFRVANRLAGNGPTAAVLEVAGGGLGVEALDRVRIALAGADLDARVNAEPFPPGTQRVLYAGDRVVFGLPRSGVRAYLAVAGGVAVPQVLGSRSTCLAAGFGGVDGRALRAGDVIAAYPGRGLPPPAGEVPPRLRAFTGREATLRVTPGPQADWFSPEAWADFLGQWYTVGPASDRMGLRLEGCRPVTPEPRELVSEGVPPGAVQLPPSGQPILLLADRQTTGGYPKPAVVAAVDLPVAAQLLPGARVCFLPISPVSARRLLEERERLLASWAGWVRSFRLLVDGRPHRVTVEEYDC